MAKSKNTAFFCSECGYESSKWYGQCPACKAWNTFVEEPVAGKTAVKGLSVVRKDSLTKASHPVSLKEISTEEKERTLTGIKELDRVLGGGIVQGSLVLVGGDPGIGKSTLLLQMCYNISDAKDKVLYISGEESLTQIKLRAERIGECSDNLKILCETNLDIIEQVLKKEMPKVVGIGSLPSVLTASEEVAGASVDVAAGIGLESASVPVAVVSSEGFFVSSFFTNGSSLIMADIKSV